MSYYAYELSALKRAGRYRERTIYDASLIDLASNDYLGLAEQPSLAERAYERLREQPSHGAKASMLVNGYHEVHQAFERALCEANGFEAGVVVGSGFNANVAMIEALVRKGDLLILDEQYHASGMMAARLVEGEVRTFAHNSVEDLAVQIAQGKGKRIIIAVEGIYSMEGDLLNEAIIHLANEHDALLIIDEAHSSGVIGTNLMGILDFYGLPVRPNHIKMGTLGKAYGSFGAYILASAHIIDFLINRAKPIIYATAPSLFDTLLADESLQYIQANVTALKADIAHKRQLITGLFGIESAGLIVPITIGDNHRVLDIRDQLLNAGIVVGAIRQPTVPEAIIRLIARINVDDHVFERISALNILR
jgi:8-amino-7-oxononanoate synthase